MPLKTDSISVMCVEDNALVAEAIERKLAGDARFLWAGWASTLDEARAIAAERRPDVAILDQGLPGEDCFAIAKALKETVPTIGVLMLTGQPSVPSFATAMNAGLRGYLSKAADSRAIVEAVLSVGQGRTVYDAGLLCEYQSAPRHEAADEPRNRRKSIWNMLWPT